MPDLRAVRERVRRGEGQAIPTGGAAVEDQVAGGGWAVPIAIAVLILIGAVIVFNARPKTPVPASQAFYATRVVNLRSAPTSVGTQALGRLARGDRIVGRLLPADEPDERYVEISEGQHQARYVWAQNLSPNPRPPLRSGGFTGRIRRQSALYAEPNGAAAVLDSLPPGTAVVVAGSVGEGWYELSLRQGGVGYVAASAL